MSSNFSIGISPSTARILTMAGVVIVIALAFGIASVASGETNEFANETVELTNDTEPITVEIAWNDSISDPENATASVEFYNATEYDDDPATASTVLTDSIDADEGNTTTTEYNESDAGLENGEEYRVIVTADDLEVDSVEVFTETVGGGFFGGSDGAASAGVGIAIIGLVLGGAWVVSNRGGS